MLQKHRKSCLLSLFCLSTILISTPEVSSTILNGVTIASFPFIRINDNRFQGLCVDVMNAIQQRTGLNYTLYLVDDKRYGPSPKYIDGSHRITGMVADVYNSKADFAIADMTVNSNREKYVTFTHPFFSFSISGLINKKHVRNFKTLDDLALKPSNLSVGTFISGSTLENIAKGKKGQQSAGRSMKRLHALIMKNESNLIKTEEEAIRRVLTEPFVFIQEEPKNAFIASENCELTNLMDPNYYIESQYAIAVKHGSPLLVPFNLAIKQLEKEGFLRRLREKYFNDDKCTSSANGHFLTLTLSLFAIIFHFFARF